MDDRQLEAYLNLMRSLLNCPSGEENQILEANSELVDAGLVQVMLEEANNQRIDNNLDDANSLMTLAGHLMGTYGNTMPDKSSPSTYLEFLTEVLQVTEDSKGDRNLIYPLLRDNLNLVNDNFAVVLRNWARETLPNLDSQERRIYIIEIICAFSNAIQEFPLDSKSKASNLEIAIAGYEVALTVFTRQEYAEDWAKAQNNLGAAYRNRIRGEKADNLEMAISAYQASLEVYNCEAFSFEWATAQNNLGIAYFDRIRGGKAENLELAIAACETGLTDIRDSTDEYIGLPSGFLYAGVTSIISTLWAVNDVSTAILMIRFYELFLSETRPPVAIALRESQLWLRSLTVKGLREWVEESKLLSSDHKEVIKNIYRLGYKQDYQPYEKPIYWAAFCATGQ